LKPLKIAEPQTAVEWADEHFYLSAESSYLEGPWTTAPVQVAMLNAMGNDDIREVNLRKSARIGYTKMLLAVIFYFAAHKKRNIGIWREDDPAAAEFTTLELDTAMRDCKPIADIFPDLGKKNEKNNAEHKQLLGSSIHIRGGQKAGGYRALSKDVVIGDEIDAFVQNVQGKSSKEGNPLLLMFKRLVGSFFPKIILGTTPTVSGSSHIEKRENQADCSLECYVPCPHCDEYQTLKFGDNKTRHGFKWLDDDPDTVMYCCESCEALFSYNDFLDIASRCIWQDTEADIKTTDGIYFHSIKTGRDVKTPRHICFLVWAAYSSTSAWSTIVAEWLEGKDDKESLQVFVNTTLGQYWHNGVKQKMDADSLYRRRSHYPKDEFGEMVLPNEALYITAGVDTQDNRYAYELVAHGLNKKTWSVAYKEIKGNPDDPDVQQILIDHMRRSFKREDGLQLPVSLIFHDAGGSYYDDILDLAARVDPSWWIACKGDYQVGHSYIKESNSNRPKEAGCYLYMVGSTTVGDLVARQLKVNDPVPLAHWPYSSEEEGNFTGHDLRYFQMLTAEERILKRIKGKDVWIWECPKGVRNEAWDCRRYATAALVYAEQYLGLDLVNGIVPKPVQAVKKAPAERPVSDFWNKN